MAMVENVAFNDTSNDSTMTTLKLQVVDEIGGISFKLNFF